MPELPTDAKRYIEHPADITVDVAQIPDIRRDEILEAMTAPLTEFYARPDTQEKFEKWLKARTERRLAQSARVGGTHA